MQVGQYINVFEVFYGWQHFKARVMTTTTKHIEESKAIIKRLTGLRFKLLQSWVVVQFLFKREDIKLWLD